jgi:hypothetical protein
MVTTCLRAQFGKAVLEVLDGSTERGLPLSNTNNEPAQWPLP